MARIIFSDGKETKELPAIQSRLAQLGITLRSWPAPSDPRARALLEQKSLNDAEKEELLGFVQNRFEELKREKGYQTRDMVVIHEDIPLAGQGYFGFVEPDGAQFLLEVCAGDYINVPANAEHWFEMRGCTRCKAVRYFIDTSGWTPIYTGREREFAAATATA